MTCDAPQSRGGCVVRGLPVILRGTLAAMSCFLGLDIGTSAAKGVAIDGAGRVIAAASRSYPISYPRPGWSEQSPEDWWRATVQVLRDLSVQLGAANRGGESGALGRAVSAVGLSGQMHGSVFLDGPTVGSRGERGVPLRPAILWNDQRTVAECVEIERLAGGRRALVELVGNAALTGFTLPKILWLRNHEPDIYARIARVLLPKDYVRFRLCGECVGDVGDASGTLLLDVDRRAWSSRALAAAGLDPAWFPALVESAAESARVSAWAAGQTGIAPGTAVVGGSGDNQCGAVGAGVVAPGMVLATLGTSGVICAHSERPRKDLPSPGSTGESPSGPGGRSDVGRLHTMCAATGDARASGGWCVTGVMLSAAGSLQWARDALFPHESFDALVAEAERAPPGSEGLIFLPYLTGERCPHPDPDARGGWIGLTARHTRAHLVRAIIEGVTFAMGQILGLVRSTGVTVDRVRLGGGGAKSALWRQLQADVYGVPVATTNSAEGPAFGAALLAGVGVGAWPSVATACAATITEVDRVEPSALAERYAPARRVFESLHATLGEANAALSAER